MRKFVSSLYRAAFVILMAGTLAACKAEIQSSVSERDANDMISALSQAGITATRERTKAGTFSVSVDNSETASALAILNQRGLPRQQFETLGNVFDSKKMVSTPFEERARFMYAMNQELANSLTQISGVVSARVQVILPESSPLDRNQQAPRASIFIYHMPDANMAQYVPVIKNLIVNSISGLNYEDVAIAMFPTAPGGYVKPSMLGSLQAGNQIPLILLGVLLLGMFLARNTIGRTLGQFLARS